MLSFGDVNDLHFNPMHILINKSTLDLPLPPALIGSPVTPIMEGTSGLSIVPSRSSLFTLLPSSPRFPPWYFSVFCKDFKSYDLLKCRFPFVSSGSCLVSIYSVTPGHCQDTVYLLALAPPPTPLHGTHWATCFV